MSSAPPIPSSQVYNDPSAEVVLYATDVQLFRASRYHLARNSEFFKNLFDSAKPDGEPIATGLSAQALEVVLFVFHAPSHLIDRWFLGQDVYKTLTFQDVADMYTFGKKYDCNALVQGLQMHLAERKLQGDEVGLLELAAKLEDDKLLYIFLTRVEIHTIQNLGIYKLASKLDPVYQLRFIQSIIYVSPALNLVREPSERGKRFNEWLLTDANKG